MIKHIVLFKFKENLPAGEKKSKLENIKADLEALTGKVETLRKMDFQGIRQPSSLPCFFRREALLPLSIGLR